MHRGQGPWNVNNHSYFAGDLSFSQDNVKRLKLLAPPLAADYTLTLPDAVPTTANSYLISSTSGNLGWEAPALPDPLAGDNQKLVYKEVKNAAMAGGDVNVWTDMQMGTNNYNWPVGAQYWIEGHMFLRKDGTGSNPGNFKFRTLGATTVSPGDFEVHLTNNVTDGQELCCHFFFQITGLGAPITFQYQITNEFGATFANHTVQERYLRIYLEPADYVSASLPPV